MKWFDWRKLGRETQQTLRIQAVLLVTEADEAPKDVIHFLGLTPSRLFDWLAKHRKGGIKALMSRPRPGRASKLTTRQANWVRRVVLAHSPEAFGFETKLWTRKILAQIIEARFGIRLSEWTVGRLLRRLRLSYQKPRKRAYQQDPEKVAQWIEGTFPAIQEETRHLNGVIYFADEGGIRSNAQTGRTWGEVGHTPEVTDTGARFGLNFFSAVEAQGKLRFHAEHNTVNGKAFLGFLKQLVGSEDRPIAVIADGHPAHRAKIVTEYVASTQGQLNLHLLPGYSPELNPDEFVWHYLKNSRLAKKTARNLKHLQRLSTSGLQSLQRSPQIVRSFFQEEHVQYASAPS